VREAISQTCSPQISQLSNLKTKSAYNEVNLLLIFVDEFEIKRSSREFSRMNTNQKESDSRLFALIRG
jgi:hypothetical protein